MDAPGREPQPFDQLPLGGLRQRDDRRAPVQRRCDTELDRAPEAGEPRRERHLPHRVVHVVQPDHAGPARPHGREPRHAVPDLDERVARTVPAHHLAERGTREHEVAAGLADHAVAVAPRDLRAAGGVRGPHRHLDPGPSPQGRDVRGVDLRAPGLGVVEVAPGEHRDAPQPGRRGDVAELVDHVLGNGRRGRAFGFRHGQGPLLTGVGARAVYARPPWRAGTARPGARRARAARTPARRAGPSGRGTVGAPRPGGGPGTGKGRWRGSRANGRCRGSPPTRCSRCTTRATGRSPRVSGPGSSSTSAAARATRPRASRGTGAA
ncbi:MAG: hypothetical protein KatS3mg009_2048 [Acidimicrobiia bacterium]|nr:MAG: hypothetical protein KatS3mg009_2048 [Acidimicrobiia bacterium]